MTSTFKRVAPQFDLLDGRRAKRVARGEQHGFFLRLNQVRQLGGGGGLAGAVHADDGNHRRAMPAALRKSGLFADKTLLNFRARDGEIIQSRRCPAFRRPA